MGIRANRPSMPIIRQGTQADARNVGKQGDANLHEDQVLDVSKFRSDQEIVKEFEAAESKANDQIDDNDVLFINISNASDSKKGNFYLDLRPLTPEQRQEVIADLKAHILDGGQVSDDFNPETFFKVTVEQVSAYQQNTSKTGSPEDLTKTTISYGGGENIYSFSGDIKDAQKVVNGSVTFASNIHTQSDDPNTPAPSELDQFRAEFWDFTNGGEKVLNPQDATQHVGDLDKPGSWYNGITLDANGAPAFWNSPNYDGDSPGAIDLQMYQDMLVADFDFNNGISNFQAIDRELGYEDGQAFAEAMIAKNPDHTLGEEGLRALAAEVWSYATTGHNLSGETDIREMQGFLYALDPEIVESSDSNTRMSQTETMSVEAYNALPEQDVWSNDEPPVLQEVGRMNKDGQPNFMEFEGKMIPLGDGYHGRATTLTTRHIFSGVSVSQTEASSIQVGENWSMFGKNDRFVIDNSSSMTTKWALIRNGVDANLKSQGVLEDNESIEMNTDVHLGEHGELDFVTNTVNINNGVLDVAHTPVATPEGPEIVTEAFATLYPNATRADAEEFLRALDMDVSQVDHLFNETDGKFELKGRQFMNELGDDGTARDGGTRGENGLKGALLTMLFDPDFAASTIDGLPDSERPRVNILLDEPLQDLEYLGLVQLIAEKRNIDVRVVAVSINAGANPVKSGVESFMDAPTDNMVFIDVQSMSIEGNQLEYDYEMANGTTGKDVRVQFRDNQDDPTNTTSLVDVNVPLLWSEFSGGTPGIPLQHMGGDRE